MPDKNGLERMSRTSFLKLGLAGLSTAALAAACGGEEDDDDEEEDED